MNPILAIPATLMLLAALGIVARSAHRFEHTTLVTSWRWAAAALAACSATWILDGLFQSLSPEWGRLLWLVSAILLLCPAISVLGARRPGVRVWNWFVLFPLAAVLGWPALTIWRSGGGPGLLQLEGPALIGFVLATVMGVGNYLGTRYRAAALLVALAESCWLLTLTSFDLARAADPWTLRLAGVAGLATAVFIANRAAARDPRFPPGLDRLWSDFRDTFGIVWAQRVQERINARAAEQGWRVRLDAGRIEWEPGVSPSIKQETAAELEQALRWLLRRFVDEAWIESRIDGRDSNPHQPAP